MSDIPDAAVKAAIEARYNHGSDPKPYNRGRCRCGANFATAVEHLEHATRRELEAALKHLPSREPVEQPAKHGYEAEPWGSGLCLCGLPDDADCHWPDAPTGGDQEPPEQPWETVLSDGDGDLG